MAPRIRPRFLISVALLTVLAGFAIAWSTSEPTGSQRPTLEVPKPATQRGSSIHGAWRVIELAVRFPNQAWVVRPGPQAGLYVFSTQHYSYVYVPGVVPRLHFANANQPTKEEKAAAYESFIAGAGSYTFDDTTLSLKADLRKNPNEMTGDFWRYQVEIRADTMQLVFRNPPFLPGRDWRTVLVRAE